MIWQNVVTTPHRWMARYLQRRGWVCFYLDAPARHCGPGECWLQMYQAWLRRFDQEPPRP